MRVVGGVFILVVGVYLTGLFKVATLERYAQFNLRGKPAGYLGSVLVGLTFAVAWIPCVGPILGAILTLAGTHGEVNRGVLLLSAYAAGLGLPLLLSALAMNRFFRFSRALGSWLPAIHVCAGLLLVAVGLLLVTDNMTALNAYVLRLTPAWLVTRLESALRLLDGALRLRSADLATLRTNGCIWVPPTRPFVLSPSTSSGQAPLRAGGLTLRSS